MASPLQGCTLEEQRSVIRFLMAEGVKPSEIFSRMSEQYGKSCMNRANFYKWVDRFKSGRTSVGDEPRCGRPVEVSGPSLESRIDGLIRDNRRITVEMLAEKVQVSVGTVHNVIQNHLKYIKPYARWVPKELTDAHKEEDDENDDDNKEGDEKEDEPVKKKRKTKIKPEMKKKAGVIKKKSPNKSKKNTKQKNEKEIEEDEDEEANDDEEKEDKIEPKATKKTATSTSDDQVEEEEEDDEDDEDE